MATRPPPRARKPSVEELNFALRVRIVERGGDVLTSLFKWGAVAYGMYCVYASITWARDIEVALKRPDEPPSSPRSVR